MSCDNDLCMTILCVYRFVREVLKVRDSCTVMEKALAPNLTELLREMGDVCFIAPSQGYYDIYSFLRRKMFMAVWTFTVPANHCFALQFLLRTWGRPNTYKDRLIILDGRVIFPVALESRLFQYDRPVQNNTTTVSVVYFHTSLSRTVYWRMAPSLKTTDCKC